TRDRDRVQRTRGSRALAPVESANRSGRPSCARSRRWGLPDQQKWRGTPVPNLAAARSDGIDPACGGSSREILKVCIQLLCCSGKDQTFQYLAQWPAVPGHALEAIDRVEGEDLAVVQDDDSRGNLFDQFRDRAGQDD